jgi:flagellar basal-body rod modification protein FlgD
MTTATDTTLGWNYGAQTATSGNTTKALNKTELSTGAAADTGSAIKGLGDNFQTFLKLLTTQMKNQDPTKPTDTDQMTAQLVQFANVEQNIATNSRLDKLLKLQQTANMTSNLQYIGHKVEYQGNDLVLDDSGTPPEFSYELDRTATSAEINITDSNGDTVRTLTADPTGNQKTSVTWDGKDDQGNYCKIGSYTAKISAKTAKADELVGSKIYTFGKVTGMETATNGDTVLRTASQSISMNDVLAVH